MNNLHISWAEYHRLIETLALQLKRSQWQFNQIVCLAKGGLRIGDILARLYHLPLAILAVQSYGGTANRQRGEVKIASSLSMTTETLQGRVLLVDDLVDSGCSLKASVAWLKHHYPQIQELKTAVLWYKNNSLFCPDFYLQKVPAQQWIIQPFEQYETMTWETMFKGRS